MIRSAEVNYLETNGGEWRQQIEDLYTCQNAPPIRRRNEEVNGSVLVNDVNAKVLSHSTKSVRSNSLTTQACFIEPQFVNKLARYLFI